MRGVSFSTWTAVVVTLVVNASCEPATPDLHEIECGKVLYGVETPPEGQCMRLDTYEGARVRALGADNCQSWAECLVVPNGASAERGGNPLDPGRVMVTYWPCDKLPACETYALAPDGTPYLRP